MDDEFKNMIELPRYIGFSTGETMGDEMIVIETNAPKERLKQLETESCKLYTLEDYENIPRWIEVLVKEGYKAEFIDFSPHITPFHSSREWLEEYFPEVDEIYHIARIKLDNEK